MSEIKKSTFSEYSFYSILLDSDALRISVSDGRTGEYFAIVPKPSSGKSLSKVRETTLNAIEAYMDAGYPPGEVKVDLKVDLT
jgi:hypothetical protein